MKWKNSLIHRITIIMAVTLLVFSAVIIYYTVWISRIRSEQFDQTILQALDMNTEELMHDLENTIISSDKMSESKSDQPAAKSGKRN